jgi:hypothetical protein
LHLLLLGLRPGDLVGRHGAGCGGFDARIA